MDNWKSNRERKIDIKIFSESFAVHRVIQQSLQQPKKNSITRYNARYYFYFEPAHGDQRKFLLVVSKKKNY